ncbi:MAG: menaquinone biosynthesis protein [Planctomycetales bacterium]|nr:menaquinone biosynthesis protein [Planctomycetales bacterium]
MHRIGAVSYLNTKPLIYGLEASLPEAVLELDLPSRLADRLRREELDVALVPSVELFQNPEWTMVSDACIACRGPVRSVRLLFRVPPTEVTTLALDVGSRTSVVLSQILLQQNCGCRPALLPLSMDSDFYTVNADAILVIGDRAMSVDDSAFVENWDLGEQWVKATDLPFVFAMWVSRDDSLPERIPRALERARDFGLENLDAICRLEAETYDLTVADCGRYLGQQLHFTFGRQEEAGLQLFQKFAREFGLISFQNTSASLTQI